MIGRFADLAVTAANTTLFKNYTQPCAVDTYADIKVQPAAPTSSASNCLLTVLLLLMLLQHA